MSEQSCTTLKPPKHSIRVYDTVHLAFSLSLNIITTNHSGYTAMYCTKFLQTLPKNILTENTLVDWLLAQQQISQDKNCW